MSATAVPDTSHPFSGQLEHGTLTADLAKTPLSAGGATAGLGFRTAVGVPAGAQGAGAKPSAEVGSAVRT